MIYNYNKLVRDKIPEEINNIDGRKANYKILNDNEYIQELNKKLFEEAYEFIEEHSVEELADLMEVIYAIMEIKNISSNEVENLCINENAPFSYFHLIYSFSALVLSPPLVV